MKKFKEGDKVRYKWGKNSLTGTVRGVEDSIGVWSNPGDVFIKPDSGVWINGIVIVKSKNVRKVK